MIITCDKCSTRFNLDESLLKKDGSRVRCSICSNIFTAYSPLPKEDKSKPIEHDEKQSFPFEPDNVPDSLENIPDSMDEIEKKSDSPLNDDAAESVYDLDFDDDFELDNDFTDEDDTGTTEDKDLSLNKDLEFENDLEIDDDLDSEKDFELDDNLEFEDDLEHGLEFETNDDSTGNVEDIGYKEEKDTELDLELDLDMDFDDEHHEIKDGTESGLNMEDFKEEAEDLKDEDEDEESDESLNEELDFLKFNEILEHDEALIDEELPEQKIPGNKTDYTEESKEEANKEVEKSSSLLTQELNAERQGIGEDKDSEKPESGEPDDLQYGSIPADDLKKPVKQPAKVGKPVFIILFIAIIVLAGYSICIMRGITIPYISDIKIPFLTQYLESSNHATAPVNLIPDKKSINGRFVTNSSAGTLFVITGRVTNTSQIVCSHIKVTGILITKGKVKAKSKTVFCGNLIAEDKLASLKMSAIDAIMFRKTGNNNSNIKIAPGHTIPFMIVFSDLPENLKNFTVNVAEFDKEAIKKL